MALIFFRIHVQLISQWFCDIFTRDKFLVQSSGKFPAKIIKNLENFIPKNFLILLYLGRRLPNFVFLGLVRRNFGNFCPTFLNLGIRPNGEIRVIPPVNPREQFKNFFRGWVEIPNYFEILCLEIPKKSKFPEVKFPKNWNIGGWKIKTFFFSTAVRCS